MTTRLGNAMYWGACVAATGWLGADNAAAFEAFFADKGIEDRFVRVAGETRIGIKLNEPSAQRTTDVDFPGQEPSPAERAELMERVLGLASTAATGAQRYFRSRK